MQRYFTIST